MARKYEVTVTFEIATRLGYEGTSWEHLSTPDGVEEVDDQSYFSEQEVTCDGGQIELVIVADDEDDAERIAREFIDNGFEYEDDSGITWAVDNVEVEVSEVERKVESLSEAREVLDAVIGQADQDEHPLAEVALDYVFAELSYRQTTVESQSQVISELRTLIADLKAEVAALAEKVAALESTPFGPQADPEATTEIA